MKQAYSGKLARVRLYAAMPILTGLQLNAVWSDYLKHVTTLSTGAVVFIATFLEKFAHWTLLFSSALR